MFPIAHRQSLSIALAALMLSGQLFASISGRCGCPTEQPATCCVSQRVVAEPSCCSDTGDAGSPCACGAECGKTESECGCGCETPVQEQAPISDGDKLPRSDQDQQPVTFISKNAELDSHRRSTRTLCQSSSLLASRTPTRILFCIWRI